MLIAVPAEACEDCELYFHDQSLTWCHRCVPANCGWFQCVVRSAGTWNYCDDAYDVEGGDSCFTEQGSDYCGPDEDSSLRRPERWQLVKAEVLRSVRRRG